MVPPEPPTLAPGRLVDGRYRLTTRVARGGMAEVWEAADEVLARQVAVKALLPHLAADAAFVTRFRREAVAAARLSHPNIVAIYDTCSEPGCEAIVMELVQGQTLRELLDARRRLRPADAVGIASQVATALDHAHRHGLVHRDVKPANILLGGDGRVLVADFGIAKGLAGADAEVDIDLTAVGDVMGTAKYLSPEQVQGQEVDARTDVYALGVVLYEMLCGRPPFVGPTATATAAARLVDEPLHPRQIRASIPRSLDEVTMRALARDPQRRLASAGAFRAALLAADLAGGGAPDEPDGYITDTHGPVTLTAGRRSAGAPLGGSFLFDGEVAPGVTTSGEAPEPEEPARERRWVAPVALSVVVATTLALIAALLLRTEAGRDLFESVGLAAEERVAVPVLRATSFDPLGSDRAENESLASRAHDGDPNTGWRTEVYFRDPLFSGLKEGVGIVLHLGEGDATPTFDTLVLVSPTRRWSARVYAGDGKARDLTGWGAPVATIGRGDTADGAPTEVALGSARASSILLWITHLGDEHANGGFQFELREATVSD